MAEEKPKDDYQAPPGSGALSGTPSKSSDPPDPSRVTPSQQREPADPDAIAQKVIEDARVASEEGAQRRSRRGGR